MCADAGADGQVGEEGNSEDGIGGFQAGRAAVDMDNDFCNQPAEQMRGRPNALG